MDLYAEVSDGMRKVSDGIQTLSLLASDTVPVPVPIALLQCKRCMACFGEPEPLDC